MIDDSETPQVKSLGADNSRVIANFNKRIRKQNDQCLLISGHMLLDSTTSDLKKIKYVYVSNLTFYITSEGQVTKRFSHIKIYSVIVAGLSGELAILIQDKEPVLIDSVGYQTQIVQLLTKHCRKQTQIVYVNNTCLKKYLGLKKGKQVTPIGKVFVDLRRVGNELPSPDILIGKSRYKTQRLIIETDVSKIYYVTNVVTSIPFAMKSVRKDKYLQNKELLRKTLNAVEFHETVKSKFICRCAETFVTSTRTYMVFQYLSSYTLAKVLSKKGKIKEEFVRVFLAEIAAALSLIHDNGYVYNNLRLNHAMLDQEGHIKLIDFNEVERTGTVKKQLASVEYASPEELNKEPLAVGCDWWQLGVLAYEVMFGYNPFLDNSQQKMKENIKSKDPDIDNSSGYSQKAMSFICELLKKNSQQRLGSKNGFYQVLKHPFFQGLKPGDVVNRKLDNPYSTHNSRKSQPCEQSFCEQDPRHRQLDLLLEGFKMDAGGQ